MSRNKRYYWLKLKEDFFEEDTILWLEEQENGHYYVNFYLKLFLKSLKDNGQLIRYVGERLIPYDIKALAKLTNTSPDTVAVAMKLFLDIGLVENLETGEIYMTQINEMIGSETESARRMRQKRLLDNRKQELLESASHCAHNVQKCDTELELELEIDKEIDREEEEEEKKQETPAATTTDFKIVINFFENNYYKAPEFIKQDLKEWIENIGSKLVIEALKRSVEAQKNYDYAKGIMKDWNSNNFKTIEDIEKQDKEYASRKKKYSKSGRNQKKETIPEWTKKDYVPAYEDKKVDKKEVDEKLLRLRKKREEERIM